MLVLVGSGTARTVPLEGEILGREGPLKAYSQFLLSLQGLTYSSLLMLFASSGTAPVSHLLALLNASVVPPVTHSN